MARASATRRAMPPEISDGARSRAPRSPTALSFISTRSRSSASGRSVCSRSGKATFSNTDWSVKSAPNWNSMPILRRSAYRPSRVWAPTSAPPNSTWPRFALHEPADQTQDRRLAATRPAHDRDHLATRETHVQVGQDEPVAVTEVDVAKLKQGLGGSRHGSRESFYARGRIIGPVRKRCADLPFDEITFPNSRHYRANSCCSAETAAAVSCASVTARTTAALPTPVASTSRSTSPFTPPIATSGTRPSSNRT